MNIDKAINILERHKYEKGLPDQGSTWKPNADTIAIDLAISALEAQQADRWVQGKPPEKLSESDALIIIEYLTPFTKASRWEVVHWFSDGGYRYSSSNVKIAIRWKIFEPFTEESI